MSAPAKKDYTLFAGAAWSKTYTYATRGNPNTPINLSGYKAVLGLKINQNDATNFLELNTQNSGIALGNTAGTIAVNFTPANTGALPLDSYFYSLYLIDASGNPLSPLLTGKFNVSRQTLPSGG